MKCPKLMDKKLYLTNIGIEEISNSYEIFKNSFQDKIYKITYDDETSVSFKIRDINLPHLLGINSTLGIYKELSKYLDASDLFTAYDLMMYMINNREKFMLASKKINLPIDYNNIIRKCRSFNNFENLFAFNFIGMHTLTSIEPLKSKEFIITEGSHEFFNYSMLGIRESRKYVYPETIIPATHNDETFKNQEFKIPEKMEIIEKTKKQEKIISLQTRQQLLKKYRSILTKDESKRLIKQA